MIQKSKKFWAESSGVKKTVATVTVIATLYGGLVIADSLTMKIADFILPKTAIGQKADSTRKELDSLKVTLVTKAELKTLQDSVLETKTKIDLIYDLLVKNNGRR